MSRLAYRLVALLLVASLAATLFFYMGVRERDHYLSELIDATLDEVDLESATDVAIALSNSVYHRTNSAVDREDLSAYDRLESLSPFNVTTAVALKHGTYGVQRHEVSVRAGR